MDVPLQPHLLEDSPVTLTPELEETLLRLSNDYKGKPNERTRIELEMVTVTEGLDEHPEWYDLPCSCNLCLSYSEA